MKNLQKVLVAFAVLGLSSAAVSEKRPKHTIDFDHYWTLEEVKFVKSYKIGNSCNNLFFKIEEYMHEMTLDFPALASIESYGRTVNDEHLEALVVRKGSPKATVVIEAGLRGRFFFAITKITFRFTDKYFSLSGNGFQQWPLCISSMKSSNIRKATATF